uniref:STEEP1 domain-containing protein n=1 Tax=Alexandrium catenella TaxID=2925 RepID=A0A7S1LNM7_ALECA|mmetsp:Transcript_11727/g.32037  ORF Transcript_11727/g.32037 Transcript_11727/m.32037 type:complete len:203 (+) Transcript_11727:86-694(+)
MMHHAGEQHAQDLAEVEKFQNQSKPQAAQAQAPTGKYKGDDPNWRAKTTDNEMTLADIKRRQREELAEQLEEGQQKRFKIVNFTSEDSTVVGERRLFSFYCSICGEHCVTSETDCFKLPRRSTDKAMALEEAATFHKKYANFGERILLRRQNGVEKQYRFYCRQCRQPLGYRNSPPAETAKFSYFYDYSLVGDQSAAIAFQK